MPEIGHHSSTPAAPEPVEKLCVLLIEDDAELAATVAECLVHAGYTVDVVHDGGEGLRRSASEPYDALIVDRMLPGVNGLDLVKRLREAGCRTPALMLTAMGRLQDRVDGLDAGADDYLVKPFAIVELLARIRSLTRRSGLPSQATRLAAGPIVMDLVTRQVFRDGVAVLLQPREFRLLEELVRHAGGFVPRVMLLDRVWNMRFDPRTKIIETHMSRLRSKLNAYGPDIIETMRGMGYRIRID